MVRQMKGPQVDVNKRLMKAQFILSSNKVVMDEGAVADIDHLAEEVSRADGIIVKKPNKHLDINADRDLAPAHLDLMSRSLQMIQSVSGITDENMGRATNATSGKAITARQDQGALATAMLFDNLRYARQVHGSKMLSLIEQYMTDTKQFRITNMAGRPEFVTVNNELPENDIVRSKADFIISEDDWNASIRQSKVSVLLELMRTMGPVAPEAILTTLDLILETMDIPMKDEIVKRVRAINGQADPDADPNNPDPETIARQQAAAKKSQMAEKMMLLEMALKEADVKEKTLRAEKAGVETVRILAEVKRILAQTAGANVETQVKALEAAASITNSKALAPTADRVLEAAAYNPAPNTGAAPPAPPAFGASAPAPEPAQAPGVPAQTQPGGMIPPGLT